MPYIVAKNRKTQSGSVTIDLINPPHEAGDLIIYCLTQDHGDDTIAPVTSGWTMVTGQGANAGSRQVWAYKIADSSNEPNPTFTGDTSPDEWIAVGLVIRDVDPTTPINTSVRGDWYNSLSETSPSATTTSDDCLILHSWGSDTSNFMSMNINEVGHINNDVYGTFVATCIGWRNQYSSGVTTTVSMTGTNLGEGGNSWVIAINNKSGGALAAEGRPLHTVLRYHGTNRGVGTFSAPNSIVSITDILGVAMHSDIRVSSDIKTSYLQYAAASVEAWVGAYDTLDSIVDLSGSVISLQWEALINTVYDTRLGEHGLILVFVDSSDNWVAFQLADFDQLETYPLASSYIDIGNAIPIDSSTSAFDNTDVVKVGYFAHKSGSSSSQIYFDISYLVQDPSVTFTGGALLNPASFNDLEDITNGWGVYGRFLLQGVAQGLSKDTLNIGDGGTTKTVFVANSSSFEFPPPYSEEQFEWNVASGTAGITINLGADDTVNFNYCIIATSQPAFLNIDSGSSASASYDFTGAVLVGFSVSWDVIDCSDILFVECDIDGKDKTFTKCSFSDSELTIANGASVESSVFSGDQYAIVIPTAGSYALLDCAFSGFTKDIDITATTGTVTITLSSGMATPTYQTAGATVTFVIPSLTFSFTVNPSITGYEWRIYNVTAAGSLAGSSEQDGEETATADNQSYAFSATATIAVQIIAQPNHAYVESVTYYELGSADMDVTVNLEVEENL